MRQQKAKEGEERKVKVKATVKNLDILLSEHSWTSQGNILHLNQGHQVYDLLNDFVVRFSSL